MNIDEVKEQVDNLRNQINQARANLAAELMRGSDIRNQRPASDLQNQLNAIASMEGEEHVWLQVRYMLESNPDIERAQVEVVLTSMLLEGADDQWSGRTNDIKRAMFEGTRDAVRAFIKFM